MTQPSLDTALPGPPPWYSPTSWRGSGPSTWLPAGITAFVLAILVLPPIWVLVRESITQVNAAGEAGPLTLANYAVLFADPKLYSSAWNSIVFSTFAAVAALIAGSVVAWLVERSNAPFKSLAYLTAIVSLGTPYIMYVGAWLFLLGRVGPLNDLYRRWTGATDILFNVNSMAGLVLIEGFLWSPLVFLLMSAIFRRANAEMEEAARMCGASIFRTVWQVSIKLAWPAILGLGLFVFIRNLEAFDAPVLIGTPGRINLLTTDVYFAIRQIPPRMGQASAFAVVLLCLVAALLYFYGKVARRADRYASVTGKGYRLRPFDLGRARWLGGGIIVLNFLLVLVLPMIAVLWVSFMPFPRPINLVSTSLMTLDHYRAILFQDSYLDLAFNTFFVSGIAATGVMAITVVAGWLSVRRWPGAGILDQLASFPLVFPGIVLGVAMLQVALNLPIPLYNTLWLIGLAFLIRYLPYGMRYTYSGMLQIHRELEEAGGASGASQRTILRRIVAPMLAPAVLAGWLFIFLLGARELSIAVLLSGATSRTMAVVMFDQFTNGRTGEAAALGVGWTAVMTVFAGALYVLMRRLSGNEEK